jgi:hypothetical protein
VSLITIASSVWSGLLIKKRIPSEEKGNS